MKSKENKIIAVINQKGGVGKTTTALNLAVGLKRQNKKNKILLIDLDPQASLTVALGFSNPDEEEFTIGKMLKNEIEGANYERLQYINESAENIDFIPANIDLSNIDMSLFNAMSREFILKNLLNTELLFNNNKVKFFRENYDYIIIDSPPSLGLITINILTAATDIIIPVQAQYLAVRGMTDLVKTIRKIKKQLNPTLNIMGILLTIADMRLNVAKLTLDTLEKNYGDNINIFKTIIPVETKLSESQIVGKSIFDYNSNGKAAIAYLELTKEVIGWFY